MKALFKSDIAYFKKLTLRDRLILIYFVICFVAIGSVAETHLPGLLFIVANFANSVRLLRTVPTPPDHEE